MGFWKSLGKGLLKVAPFAAAAIPGIGPAVSMAIQGGLGAANAKVSGGGLKDVLMGAGMGALSGKLGKGLSPSKSFHGDIARVAAKASPKSGFMSTLGNIAKGTGKNILENMAGNKNPYVIDESGAFGGARTPPYFPTGGGGSWQGALRNILGAAGNKSSARTPPFAGGGRNIEDYGRPKGWETNARYEGRMRGLGPVMGRRDQNFPNLAESIGAGRQDALRNQPWRGGYNIMTIGSEPDEAGNYPEIPVPMPPIYPTGRRLRQPEF